MSYRNGGKRLLDVAMALLGLAVFAVPVLVGVLMVKVSSPGPALFRQTRVGRGGQAFRIYKLRTMNANPDRKHSVQVSESNPEVFPAGRALRRFKIDELPQIFNVLRGEMSFVGPRPMLEETRTEMAPWAQRRFVVRPGITGLAQTRGNVALSWEQRWEQDIEYVDNLSFRLDAWLVGKTVLVVLLGEERFGSAR